MKVSGEGDEKIIIITLTNYELIKNLKKKFISLLDVDKGGKKPYETDRSIVVGINNMHKKVKLDLVRKIKKLVEYEVRSNKWNSKEQNKYIIEFTRKIDYYDVAIIEKSIEFGHDERILEIKYVRSKRYSSGRKKYDLSFFFDNKEDLIRIKGRIESKGYKTTRRSKEMKNRKRETMSRLDKEWFEKDKKEEKLIIEQRT